MSSEGTAVVVTTPTATSAIPTPSPLSTTTTAATLSPLPTDTNNEPWSHFLFPFEYRGIWNSSNTFAKLVLATRLSFTACQVIAGVTVYALTINQTCGQGIRVAFVSYLVLLVALVLLIPKYFRLARANPHEDAE
jgi:hypothetical protein